MSREDITPAEYLMYDLTVALDAPLDVPAAPVVDSASIAIRGKPAITSLYVESLMAVDRLPKPNVFKSLKSLGRTALSNEGEDMLSLVDDAIALNPLYNTQQYLDYGQYDWSLAEPSIVSNILDTSNEDYIAELGLVGLGAGVNLGASASRHRSLAPNRIIQAMEVKGALDTVVLNSLREIRTEGKYTNRDYVTGLLGSAELVSKDIYAQQTRLKQIAEAQGISLSELEEKRKRLERNVNDRALDRKVALIVLAGTSAIEGLDIGVDHLIPGFRGSLLNTLGSVDKLLELILGTFSFATVAEYKFAKKALGEIEAE
jgi:hypothetical protein